MGEAHHVSNFEGGRGYAAVCVWGPLGFVAGCITGFAAGMLIKGAGFGGYLKRQIVAFAAIATIVLASGALGYARADHPPSIDGKSLALDIEVRVPKNGRSLKQIKGADFTVALVATASDRNYSDLRWSEASETEEFITARAWAPLNSRNADRQITAGVRDENRQVFRVMLRGSPAHIDEGWSEWAPASQRFDGSNLRRKISIWFAIASDLRMTIRPLRHLRLCWRPAKIPRDHRRLPRGEAARRCGFLSVSEFLAAEVSAGQRTRMWICLAYEKVPLVLAAVIRHRGFSIGWRERN